MSPDHTAAVDWQQLFREAPLPCSVIDTQGRTLAANPAFARFLGYGDDEIQHLDVGRMTRPDDAEWTQNYLLRLISGEIDEFVTLKQYVRKDGSITKGRLHARGLHDEHGVCSLLLGIIVPVDERTKPGPSISDHLLAYTSDSLTLVDVDGNVLESTGRHTRIIGYPTEWWEDRNIMELIANDERIDPFALRDQLIANPDQVVEVEAELLNADGTPQIIAVRAINRLDDPNLNGIVLATRNVTEEQQVLHDLESRCEAAEQLANAQAQVLATVSHELRNPLHAIRGVAELLAAEDLPAKVIPLADSLLRQVSGLASVTQDLLDAATFDASRTTLVPTPTELRPLIEDVVALGQIQTEDRPVEVSANIGSGLPDWVIADGNRLQQILRNLVGNACKFTEQGSVQLMARAVDGDGIVFSVVDTGVGIPPEEQPKILEPFTIGSTAGRQRGSGLGLSVVHRLVNAMEGRLRLESAVGEGTRIDVELPLPRVAAPTAAAPAEVAPGLTVMVVEDNPVNQQLASRQLEQLGLVPMIYDTAEDAIEALSDSNGPKIDVILMDHQLPGMNGTEATRCIRSLPDERSEIPVIGLSASASKSDQDAFTEAGMNDFIPKPASLDDLVTVIARTLGERVEPDVADRGAPEADAFEPGQILDESALDGLAVDVGDEAVGEIVAAFLADLENRILAIVNGLETGDASVRSAAHTLKSSAALVGAATLASYCAEIERGDDDITAAAIERLAARTREALTGWRSSRS